MLFPSNGKVIIFDDKYEDVKELIAGLSSEKIPFVYFQDENMHDMPDSHMENVRLIFLDLLLLGDEERPVKEVISSIVGRLKIILGTANGPYILFYFSTKRKRYGKALEKELSKKKLKNYKPFLILNIPKGISFDEIKEKIKTEFEKIKSLRAFFLLESLTNDAIGKSVNDILAVHSNDNNWDRRLKGLIYKCASAVVGKENVDALSDVERLKNGMWAFSTTFPDSIEKWIRNFNENLLDNIKDFDVSPEAKARINSKLSLLSETVNHIENSSGNLFLKRKNETQIKKYLLDSLQKDKRAEDVISHSPKIVELDITPVCDYSQYKNYLRILPGITLTSESRKLINEKCEHLFITPFLEINSEIISFMFDFRYIYSTNKEELNSRTKIKIRYELLTEIQSRLSKYINRPGIITVK